LEALSYRHLSTSRQRDGATFHTIDLDIRTFERPHMNTHHRLIALAAATLLACSAASAQSTSSTSAPSAPMLLEMAPNASQFPYLVDGSRHVVRNQTNLCWRTGFWTLEAASTAAVVGQPFPVGCYCDPELMAKPLCEPKPVTLLSPPSETPTPVPAAGPVATAEKVTIPADALFEYDKAAITPAGKERIEAFAQQLKAVNLEAVVAGGHADRIGSDQYNQALSERRAQSIKTFLVAQGVDPARVFIEGKGETQPVTGTQCQDMGKETARNRKLVDCLAPDRRVVLEAVGTRR
jgi:OOP family OmpA-OmpF porin